MNSLNNEENKNQIFYYYSSANNDLVHKKTNNKLIKSDILTVQSVERCQARVQMEIHQYFEKTEKYLLNRIAGLVLTRHFNTKSQLIQINLNEFNKLKKNIRNIIEQEYLSRFRITKPSYSKQIKDFELNELNEITSWIKIKNRTTIINETIEKCSQKFWERALGSFFASSTLNRILGDYAISLSLLELSGISTNRERADYLNQLKARIHSVLDGYRKELGYNINYDIAQMFYETHDRIQNGRNKVRRNISIISRNTQNCGSHKNLRVTV